MLYQHFSGVLGMGFPLQLCRFQLHSLYSTENQYFREALIYVRASQVAQWQRICLLMQEAQEVWVQFPGLEDPLEKEMATHSRILAWKIPRTKETGGPQYMESQRLDISE